MAKVLLFVRTKLGPTHGNTPSKFVGKSPKSNSIRKKEKKTKARKGSK
jgi:hypothetical protein